MGSKIAKEPGLAKKVFGLTNEKDFAEIALAVYLFQFQNNPIYRSFCEAIRRSPNRVSKVEDIPFLPIRFFKTHEVKTGSFAAQAVFESSGTTGTTGTTGDHTSRHFVKDLSLYEQSFTQAFEKFYGPVEGLCVLGLLPSYLERGGSSLVYMVDRLIKQSGHTQSGFYLHDHQRLHETLQDLEAKGQPTVLFGVSYALLDFAEKHALPLKHTTVIETGGMKGRRKELAKEELYERLQKAFTTPEIHSEYGMTELLSQAYAVNGRYQSPPWMKVLLREETDPFAFAPRTGAVNVIDLANLYSCCFIATDDRGLMHEGGHFEILGRLDNSDVRGCSQLVN